MAPFVPGLVRHFGLTLLLVALCGGFADAQPVPSRAPSSTHIYPAGGRRGESIAVRVGAECLPPGADFSVFGEGVQATRRLEVRLPMAGEPSPRRAPTEVPISYPREWQSRIEIAGDAPLGSIKWRLSCAQGGTACRPFMVGDLPEHLERESNSIAASAEQVTLPVTLNGQICGERDMDYYRFALTEGETAVVDVYAARIGSRLDPIVEILGPDGQRPPVAHHYVGSDQVIAFEADRTGPYLLRVANVSVHGSPAHVYRINVTTKLYARLVVPAGGRAGTTSEVRFVGLGSDRPIVQRVVFPDAPGPFSYYDRALAAPITLYAESGGVRSETEPNERDQPERVVFGNVVYGACAGPEDADWFRLRAGQGESMQFTCQAFPPGSAALPVVTLYASDGRVMKQVRSLQSGNGVCRLESTAPASGEYLVRVSDLRFGARGSDAFLYRFAVDKSLPHFSISTESDVVNVEQGGRVELEVQVERQGGFSGELQLKVEGLPAHVQVENARVEAGKSTAKLVLRAGGEVVAQSSRIRIFGVAVIDGKPVRHGLRSEKRNDDTHILDAGQAPDSALFLSVMHKPVFRLHCSEAYLYAHRGSVFPYPMEVERLNGFEGEIHLQIGDRQNRDLDGIEMLPITVPAGRTSVHMPIYLPESMHINVQSQSQLYTQAFARFKDHRGNPQSLLVVSEKRNMLRTRPPVAKLTAVDSRVEVTPGEPAQVRLRLKRTSNFLGSLRIHLEKSSRTGISCEPQEIGQGSHDAVLHITPPLDLAAGEEVRLTFRGQGDLSDSDVIISEAQVVLRCTDRAE